MSFTLKSIELKNIKAHEHFLFEPALEGVTAISGENGAGKSTIVDSFAWCLYGTRPSGIRNKNLIRDGVDPKSKPVSIKAHISIDGIDYIVERKIITAQGQTECNVWGKSVDSDEYTMVAGPAVSHVEKFIRQEVGMNEKGFLASVLIQQKQVDAIVSASPRERGIVIEELTGISSITEAIRKTNENSRELQKAASIFHIGDIDEAEERVEKQKEAVQAIQDRETHALSVFKRTKQEYEDLVKEHKIEEVKVKKRDKLKQREDNLITQIEFLKKQAKEDLEYIENHKNKYGTTRAVNVESAKDAVDVKKAESYEIKSKITGFQSELVELNEDIEKCKILMNDFNDYDKASEELHKLQGELETYKAKQEELRNERSMLTSEIKHANESHKHINGEDKNCPVCKSKIEDPEQLKGELEQDIKDFESRRKEVVKEIKENEENISELETSIQSTIISIEAIKEEKILTDKRNKREKELHDLAIKLGTLEATLKVLEREYNTALQIEADKQALDGAKKRSLTVNTTIRENADSLEAVRLELTELAALSDRSFNALTNRVESLSERVTKMSIAGKEIVGRKALELERLKDYEKGLKEVQIAMEKYDKIAKEINVSTGAAAMLTAFKADRIEQSIPTLEFYSSDFLTKFTGGAFTKMTVDEKFNTFVTTASGVVRPVAQLSGGELSSAAIALRLGIAMLLNSSKKNVLILDEVLVSMDEDRSRQIMETISSMTNSQIIFIAHNTDINSIADKTVLIGKGE